MDLMQNMLGSWIMVDKPEDQTETRTQLVVQNLPQDILELCETEDELAELMKLLSLSSNNNHRSSPKQHDPNNNADQTSTENNNNHTKRRTKVLPPTEAVSNRVRYEIKRLKRCTELNQNSILYYRTRSDLYCLPLEVGSLATRPFGFHFLQRVDTPKGSATVLGVYRGCLFVHVDTETGASFWDNGVNHQELLKIGFSVSASQKPHEPTLEKIAKCLVRSTQLNLLRITHMIEWRDVVSGAQLRDNKSNQMIQAYFERCPQCNNYVARHRVCTGQVLKMLKFFYDKKRDKHTEVGAIPSSDKPASDFACDIHSYYIPKDDNALWMEEFKRQVRVEHNPRTLWNTPYTSGNSSAHIPSQYNGSEASTYGYSGTYSSNNTRATSTTVSPSSTSSWNSYSTNTSKSVVTVPCPFCNQAFTEDKIDDHAIACAAEQHTQPVDVLPDVNFKDQIDRFTYRRSDTNSIRSNRAPSRVPTLWASCLVQLGNMGQEVILQLLSITATVELTPAVSAAVKRMCLAHLRPNFSKMSLDQLREIPKEEREALILERLEADPKSIGTVTQLAHFLNTNISLEHTTVLKVVQTLLNIDVLISLFELCATHEEFVESDAVKNYLVDQLKKVDLLKLQESKSFNKLPSSLQNLLIQECVADASKPSHVDTSLDPFEVDMEAPYADWEAESDGSYMSDAASFDDEDEEQEEEEEE